MEMTIRQSSVWSQAHEQGNYEEALKVTGETESKLTAALLQLQTSTAGKGETRTKNIAQLNYMLSLTYFQQGTSNVEMGAKHQLQSDFVKAVPLLKDGALLMLKSWELMQANAPLIGLRVDQKVGLQALAALLNVAESYQSQGQFQAAQPLLEQGKTLLEQSHPAAAESSNRESRAAPTVQCGPAPTTAGDRPLSFCRAGRPSWLWHQLRRPRGRGWPVTSRTPSSRARSSA